MQLQKTVTIRGKVINLACLSVGFVLGLIVFFAFNYFFPVPDESTTNQIRENNSQYHFINPLLECNLGNSISTELHAFNTDVQNHINDIIAQGNASVIAIYFRDLNNGFGFGINQNEQFIPASLLKVPLMIAYFKESESNPAILDKKIVFTGTINQNTPYFKGAHNLVVGRTYTISQLISRMIVDSDNDAYDLLLLNTDSHQLDDVFKYLDVNLPSDKIVLTVQQYATFFRILYNGSYLNHDNSEKALALLNQTNFDVGLKAGIPSSVAIAHKFGEKWDAPTSDKQLHDCGIVYYPNHPYLVCIMTRGGDFNQLASVIADMSKFIYNQVDSQFK